MARRDLAGLKGVRAVQANPVTGSLLLRHSRDFAWPADTAHLPFSLTSPSAPAAPALTDARQGVRRVDQEIARFTGGALDLTSLTFLLLIAMSIVQLVRGNIATPAVTALWYATQIAQIGSRQGPQATP